MPFLLFSSPKPRSQVRILIYRNWSISLPQKANKRSVLETTRFLLISWFLSRFLCAVNLVWSDFHGRYKQREIKRMITWLSVFLWTLVFAIALASPVKTRPSESVEGGSNQTDSQSASNAQHIFLAGLSG